MTSIRVRNAILCEDGRQDKNNKYILTGVFSGAIQLASFPGTIPICFYVALSGVPETECDYMFRLSGPGEGQMDMKVRMKCEDPDGEGAVLSPVIRITCHEEGFLKLEGGPSEDELETIFEKRIRLDPSAAKPNVVVLPYEKSPTDAPAS